MKNLFDYATKELSQDAFLMWMFDSWEDKDLQPVVENLIRKFCNKEFKEIRNIEVQPQWHKIDVSIHFDADGVKQHIFIEDKTTSLEHNQLSVYSGEIKKEYDDNNCYKVFYKTSLISPQEKERIYNAEWVNIYDVFDICDFFSKFSDTKNIILSQYIEHIKKQAALCKNTDVPNCTDKKEALQQWTGFFAQFSSKISEKYKYDIQIKNGSYATLTIWKADDNIGEDKKRSYPTLEICSKDCKVNILCRDARDTTKRETVGELVLQKDGPFKKSIGTGKICVAKNYFSSKEDLESGFDELFEIYELVLNEWQK